MNYIEDPKFTFEEFKVDKENIIKKYEKIIIKKMMPTLHDVTYEIIKDRDEYLKFYKKNKEKYKVENNTLNIRDGAIITYKNGLFFFEVPYKHNLIFIEDIEFPNPITKDLEQIDIICFNCYFLGKIQKFNHQKSLYFKYCKFFDDVDFKKNNFENLSFWQCDFKKNLLLSKSNINNFEMNICTLYIGIFTHTKIDGKFSIFGTSLIGKNSKLDLSFSIFNGIVKLIFSTFDGKMILIDTFFLGNANIICKDFKSSKYEQFKLKYTSSTCANLNTLSNLYYNNGTSEEYLDVYYLKRKYERKSKFHNIQVEKNTWSKLKLFISFLIDLIIEITSKYFTSWGRVLISIIILIFGFSIIYYSFPKFNITTPQNEISTILDAIYFSAITFTTIGYGDISPTDWIKYVAAFEGLLGVVLISVLTICLSRRYVK